MKRHNSKILIGAFLGLLGFFLIIKTFYSPKLESNIAKDFAVLDTSSISLVKIHQKGKSRKKVYITRTESGWMATTKDTQGWVSHDLVIELLASLEVVHVDRLVASDKNGWNELYVSDTLGIQIVVSDEEKLVADWHIGTSPAGGSSYIRSNDEEKVYLLEDSKLASLVHKPIDDWRDKNLIKFVKSQIDRIVFNFPADSSFTIVKNNSTWTTGHKEIESSLIDNYLNNICSRKIFSFANDSLSINSPDATIEFWSRNNSLGIIKGWKHKDNWIVSSSYQFSNCFFIMESTMQNEVLLSKNKLLSNRNSK